MFSSKKGVTSKGAIRSLCGLPAQMFASLASAACPGSDFLNNYVDVWHSSILQKQERIRSRQSHLQGSYKEKLQQQQRRQQCYSHNCKEHTASADNVLIVATSNSAEGKHRKNDRYTTKSEKSSSLPALSGCEMQKWDCFHTSPSQRMQWEEQREFKHAKIMNCRTRKQATCITISPRIGPKAASLARAVRSLAEKLTVFDLRSASQTKPGLQFCSRLLAKICKDMQSIFHEFWPGKKRGCNNASPPPILNPRTCSDVTLIHARTPS